MFFIDSRKKKIVAKLIQVWLVLSKQFISRRRKLIKGYVSRGSKKTNLEQSRVAGNLKYKGEQPSMVKSHDGKWKSPNHHIRASFRLYIHHLRPGTETTSFHTWQIHSYTKPPGPSCNMRQDPYLLKQLVSASNHTSFF